MDDITIERESVESSLAKSVGYHADSQTLEVELASGKLLRLHGVGQEDYDGLRAAESFGKHFSANFRGKFEHSYVEPK